MVSWILIEFDHADLDDTLYSSHTGIAAALKKNIEGSNEFSFSYNQTKHRSK